MMSGFLLSVDAAITSEEELRSGAGGRRQ